jgi:hypothetical protein
MPSANAPRDLSKAIALLIITEQLRLAWEGVVEQELPPRIQRLVAELERSLTRH